ncbi:hypothetical protein MSG28_012404 [Choristoneura fumiferana]|uniref:Uncharacterized protein n=2 Tax=Choristoneura fumiferana TaxID=7141 RepID=A0ACC0KCU6_CHOFU|nr:hypothetical protein MSG28_012404 [Choristoneura fumiferana]
MTDEKSIEDLMGRLKEWVTQEPHIPKDMDDKLLRRFLHCSYYDIEKAQNVIESFSSLRATSPELFNDRDPLSKQIQNTLKIVNLARIKASGNRLLWLSQINDPGLRNFDHLQLIRLFLLVMDAWILDEEGLVDADVIIIDAKDISLRMLTKMNISVARKMAKYQEEAMPIRLKQMHVYNSPTYMDKIFSVMKQFLKHDISDMIHFHLPNSDTLYKHVSRDELPSDFGGILPSMKEQTEKILEVTYKHRESLLNDSLWKAPEKKSNKTAKKLTSSVLGLQSLRQQKKLLSALFQ